MNLEEKGRKEGDDRELSLTIEYSTRYVLNHFMYIFYS